MKKLELFLIITAIFILAATAEIGAWLKKDYEIERFNKIEQHLIFKKNEKSQ